MLNLVIVFETFKCSQNLKVWNPWNPSRSATDSRIVSAGGCPVVVVQWQSTGGSSQVGVLGMIPGHYWFSLSSIFIS